MTDLEWDLTGAVLVTRSEVVYHPESWRPVMKIQTGWRKGDEVKWNDDLHYAEIEVEDV
jgi:hypothetical protein